MITIQIKKLLLGLLLVQISCKNEETIFTETFDKNIIGWPEETTSFHKVEINNGKYSVLCKDTNSNQSSVAPLKEEYLLGLPNKYEISVNANFIKGERKKEFGIILNSISVSYRFSVSKLGKLEIEMWMDFLIDEEKPLAPNWS